MTRARPALLALDIALCAVILVVGAGVVTTRARLHSYDAAAKEIASWAAAQGIARIAWPADRREAVPALLASGVTPVLVDSATPPAQDLAINSTPVLVSTDRGHLAVLTRAELQVGDLHAAVIDLAAAAKVPLAKGEALGEQISRPYLYAPLRDSLQVRASKPMVVPVTLAAGHYVLTMAVFDPGSKASATLAATRRGAPLAATTMRLPSVVTTPMRIELDVADPVPAAVDLRLVVTGPGSGGNGYIHEWELRREDGTS